MKLKALVIAALTAALLAIPTVAQAAWGHATGDVNMRACPSVKCDRITVVPAGAPVWIMGNDHGWYLLRFDGARGYVSGKYVNVGASAYVVKRPPAPTFGYWHTPVWDSRYHAWYDGHRWYRDGVWLSTPRGLHLGVGFGIWLGPYR